MENELINPEVSTAPEPTETVVDIGKDFLESLGMQIFSIVIAAVVLFLIVKLISKFLKSANSSADKRSKKQLEEENIAYALIWEEVKASNKEEEFKELKTYEERALFLKGYMDEIKNNEELTSIEKSKIASLYIYIIENYIKLDIIDPGMSINEELHRAEIEKEKKEVALAYWSALTEDERSRYKIIANEEKRKEWLAIHGGEEDWLDASLINYVDELDFAWQVKMGQ